MQARKALSGGVLIVAALVVGVVASRPAAVPFDSGAVRRGEALAKVGGCQGCHTGRGGRPFAGGAPIGTPFGAVYSSNVTPDAATGIGRWSLADFRRALRDGTAPGGKQLYPAFPYDHFTHLTDQDIADLYAYLETREPVSARTPPSHLAFPFSIRPLLVVWKALFLHRGAIERDSSQSADWNRGRYLVDALGHCGACHTPHDSLGGEERAKGLAGGWTEGWYAPPLDGASPAATPWTLAALEAYLRTGLSETHAAAAGPMGNVTRELAGASPADVRAMAVYIASGIGVRAGTTADRDARAAADHPQGARLFAGACATCHEAGAPMMNEGRPNLALGTPLHEADPADTVQIVLKGLRPPAGRAGPTMPPFAGAFSDADVADLAAYLRERYTTDPPWRGDIAGAVAKARKGGAG